MTSTPAVAFLGADRMGLPLAINLAAVYAGATAS